MFTVISLILEISYTNAILNKKKKVSMNAYMLFNGRKHYLSVKENSSQKSFKVPQKVCNVSVHVYSKFTTCFIEPESLEEQPPSV